MSVFSKIRQNFIVAIFVRVYGVLSIGQRRKAVLLTILSILGALAEVVGLAALGAVMLAATDHGFVKSNRIMVWLYNLGGFGSEAHFMVFLSVTLLLIFVLKNVFALYLYHFQAKFAYDVGSDLSKRMLIKFYNRGFTFFKNTNSADIQNQVMNIPIFFSSSIMISAINFFVESLVVLLVVLGIALHDWRLFLGLVTVMLPTGLLIYTLTKNKLYHLGQGQALMYNKVFNKLNQAVFGYTDVRIHNKEHVFMKDYSDLIQTYNRSHQARFVLTLVPPRALEVISIVGISITFIYTYIFIGDPSQVYQFIAIFAAAAFRILPAFSRILVAVMGMRSHQYCLDYLEDGKLPESLDRSEAMSMDFEESIEFRNLDFAFEENENPALKNVSFKVKKGEKIGIIGESGSGKTTLMNILLRFLDEKSGGMYVDGKQLLKDDKASWRAILGYVKQDVFLMDATLAENVAFGEKPNEIDHTRLIAALEQASLMRHVETLPEGVNTIVGEYGSKISGGQKQRIGIARALYAGAKVLVFDEATSSLDTETEQAITESIESISGGHTIFVIAHRISTLRFCDRIFEMKNGELVGEFSYDQILNR
jgi:ABC-type multidrug transport system fused ATPase/permease subunit